MVEVFSSHGFVHLGIIGCLEVASFFDHLSVDVEFGGEIFLELHFAEIVLVLVFKMVFWKHLDCRLTLVGLN